MREIALLYLSYAICFFVITIVLLVITIIGSVCMLYDDLKICNNIDPLAMLISSVIILIPSSLLLCLCSNYTNKYWDYSLS